MNQRLTNHIADINKKFSELPVDVRSKYSVDDSMIQERIMRIGNEVRAWEAIPPEYDEIARATLKEDFVKKYV